jgi:hypothetical protein
MLKWLKQLFTTSPGQRPSVGSRPFSYAYEMPSGLGIREELTGDAHEWVQRLDDALKMERHLGPRWEQQSREP